MFTFDDNLILDTVEFLEHADDAQHASPSDDFDYSDAYQGE